MKEQQLHLPELNAKKNNFTSRNCLVLSIPRTLASLLLRGLLPLDLRQLRSLTGVGPPPADVQQTSSLCSPKSAVRISKARRKCCSAGTGLGALAWDNAAPPALRAVKCTESIRRCGSRVFTFSDP